MNKLIFGKDQTEGVVSLTLKDDQIYIYKESDSGVEVETYPYLPWALSARPVTGHSEKLQGNQFYKYITSLSFDDYSELSKSYQRDLWLPRQIEECFTLAEGVTFFKGRKIQDISILSFDIETNGLAMNSDSKVYIISNTFRKGSKTVKRLFSLEDFSDDQTLMIDAWTAWVREQDPSILCGHNIFSYDLPFLANCHSGDLILGRDGSALEFGHKTSKFRKDGSQQYDYHNARITGREIVDTFFLSMKYDIGREFPSYGLKPIVKHLGLEKQDRSFVDASKIASYFNNRHNEPSQWANVKSYALDDSEDALKLFDLMAPPYFYLNQSIPKTFQQMINEASGSQLDALMIRSYLQDGFSQPKTSTKVPFEGAISMGIPGVYDYVLKADIASLYPSVMLQHNIHDSKKDPKNHMIQLLTYFRDERLTNKKLAKETGEKYFDDLQNAQKIMINSMYGFLGSNFLLYNYPAGGAEVTRRGREILLKGVEWATGHTLERVVKDIVKQGTEDEEISYEWKIGEKVGEGKGYQLVNVDTDSFSVSRGTAVSQDQFRDELLELNSLYPSLIRWEDDGMYEKFIVVRAKNYVLVKNGKVKFKGSAMTDQKKEPALTEMLENMIYALLNDERAAIPFIYRTYVKEALKISDISRWATKKTVTKAVLNAGRLTERKIMDAIQECIRANVVEGIQEGDKVWLYNSVQGEIQAIAKGQKVFYKDGRPKMVPNEILRDIRLWESDEDKLHYVARVYDTALILSSVVNAEMFTDFTLKANSAKLKELT